MNPLTLFVHSFVCSSSICRVLAVCWGLWPVPVQMPGVVLVDLPTCLSLGCRLRLVWKAVAPQQGAKARNVCCTHLTLFWGKKERAPFQGPLMPVLGANEGNQGRG